MKLVTTLALASLLLAATTVQAGTIHPALLDRLDRVDADEPVSVIVHMADQAPIAQMSADLSTNRATRQQRHREVVLALKDAARTQDPLRDELSARSRSGGIVGYTSYWISNLMVVLAVRAEIEHIAARPDVDFIELNFEPELIEPTRRGTSEGAETGTRSIGVTPGLEAINAPRVWYELGYTGAGRLIGSLDTGVDGSHPALSARWRGVVHPSAECWLDVLDNGTTFPTDFNDHGTHTTGTMTGLAPDDTIGVAWAAQWIASNAIDQGVSAGFDNDIIASFEWFADPDGDPETVDDVPDVVQNSWGVNENFTGYVDCDTRWYTALDNCEAAGVVLCWSAGNEGPGSASLRSPGDRVASLTNSFSVGATQWFAPYSIASFSSRGPTTCFALPGYEIKPEVSAPGVDIYSSVPGGGYQDGWDGTSMSGPHVAGIVALMRQANPDLEVDIIKMILLQSAVDLGATGEDNVYGMGFVDAYAAVQLAITGFGRLEGIVRNASFDDLPIDGAVVDLVDRGFSYTTDQDGRYSGMAGAEVYTARASSPGFAPQEVTVEIFAEGVTVQDFDLTDIAGPQITDVSQPLSTPDAVGPYPITADIADHSTIANARLYFRVNGSSWQEYPMTSGGGIFGAEIPGMPPSSQVDYYIWAEDGIGLTSFAPAAAPAEFYTFFITQEFYTYAAEDPSDPGWQLGVVGDVADSGEWVREDPVGTDYFGLNVQPEDDHTLDPGVKCFVTGNGTVGGAAGANDVDHGCTTLLSPTFDLREATMAFVKYWRWYGVGGNSVDDEFAVDVSDDGGASWQALERVADNQNSWQQVAVDLGALINFTDQVQFRFLACDLNNAGLVEVAIDDFALETVTIDITSVDDDQPVQRPMASLLQNHPNPFNPLTTIKFSLPRTEQVKLAVYTVDGQRVATLVNEALTAGLHEITWNGKDQAGQQVASGTYFYRIEAGDFIQTRRMALLK